MKRLYSAARRFARDETSFNAVEEWSPVLAGAVDAAARVGWAGYRAERPFARAYHASVEGGRQYAQREFGTSEGLKRNALGTAKKISLAVACYASLC